MKLAVIGSGNIGKSIGLWASEVGYEVIFSSKNIEHARDAARITGRNSRAESVHNAVDAGPLKAARNLEPMALLNINLGYGLGHGTSIGFSLLR